LPCSPHYYPSFGITIISILLGWVAPTSLSLFKGGLRILKGSTYMKSTNNFLSIKSKIGGTGNSTYSMDYKLTTKKLTNEPFDYHPNLIQGLIDNISTIIIKECEKLPKDEGKSDGDTWKDDVFELLMEEQVEYRNKNVLSAFKKRLLKKINNFINIDFEEYYKDDLNEDFEEFED
jgi:hypothetical protein